VVAIASGAYHNFALTSDGVAWGWGGNGAGQLADGTGTDQSTAVAVELGAGVKAIAGGDSHSLALPGAPSAPQNLSAVSCNSQVTLHWQPPATQGTLPLADFNVYRATASGQETLLTQVQPSSTSYRDTAVSAGTTYYYQMTAASAAVEGPASPEVTATVAAAVATCPEVSGVSPDAAAPGSTVTVTGRGFDATTVLMFGAVQAQPAGVDPSGDAMTVVVPNQPSAPPAYTVDVVASNWSGPSRTSQADELAYTPPQVSAVSPSGGPLNTRTRVTVTGVAFVPGSTVTAGSVAIAASDVTVESPTTLTALLPASASSQTVHVTVTNALGSSWSNADAFTYGPPVIPGINPLKGPSSGGQLMTIAVQNFVDEGVTVTIGGAPATVLGYDSVAQVLEVRTPSNPTTTTATVPVVVSTVGGTSNPVSYTYWAPPRVTAVIPAVVVQCAPEYVVIQGDNFDPGSTEVYFGTPTAGRTNESGAIIGVDGVQHTMLVMGPCDSPDTGPLNVIVFSTGGQSQPSTGSLVVVE